MTRPLIDICKEMYGEEYIYWCMNNNLCIDHINNLRFNLFDNDFYKFTMGQFVFYNYPDVHVKYKLKNRNPKNKLVDHITLRNIVDKIDMSYNANIITYLEHCGLFRSTYLDFLSNLLLDTRHLNIYHDSDIDDLGLEYEGPWHTEIYYEVILMALISRLSNNNFLDVVEMSKRLNEKIDFIKSKNDKSFKFADMSTRRRCSLSWQQYMVSKFNKECPDNFVGTSNVMIANTHKIRFIGTMAHELIQAYQQLDCKIVDSQKRALEDWAKFYRGNLGIALTDCISMDVFLQDFDLYFAKLFDGCRHDSGDPYEWCHKLIKHYEKFRIDPKTKQAIFSDSLTISKAYDLHREFSNYIQVSCGIGTHLGNDATEKASNFVLKMIECNGEPVAKLCLDQPGKTMCQNQQYYEYAKSVFERRLKK